MNFRVIQHLHDPDNNGNPYFGIHEVFKLPPGAGETVFGDGLVQHYAETREGMEKMLEAMGEALHRPTMVWDHDKGAWVESSPAGKDHPQSQITDAEFRRAVEAGAAIVNATFKPLTLDHAKRLVGRDLLGILHGWRRLYHHALSIQDPETAAFLAACIEDLERLHTITYSESAGHGEPG